MFISQVGTHIQYLFISPDNSSAKLLGLHHVHQSCTSTHILSLILKMKQTPRQMEMHYVYQSGTHRHKLSLIPKIIQTPRQM